MSTRKLAVGILMVCVASSSYAQTQRSGNDNARLMQQIQQLTAEKTQAQAESEKVKRELEELKSQLAKSSSALSASEARAKKIEADSSKGSASMQETNDALGKTRAQLQELVGKFRETTQMLRDVEIDRDQVRTQVAAKDRELKTCVDRNAGLYLLNDEILRHFEDQGVWSAIKEKELFTGISRTRLENLIDDYRYRVEELRVERKADATTSK